MCDRRRSYWLRLRLLAYINPRPDALLCLSSSPLVQHVENHPRTMYVHLLKIGCFYHVLLFKKASSRTWCLCLCSASLCSKTPHLSGSSRLSCLLASPQHSKPFHKRSGKAYMLASLSPSLKYGLRFWPPKIDDINVMSFLSLSVSKRGVEISCCFLFLTLSKPTYAFFFLQRQTIAFASFHLNTTHGSCLQISVPKTHVVFSVSKYILYKGCFLSFSLFLSQIQSVFVISQDCWSQQHMSLLSLSQNQYIFVFSNDPRTRPWFVSLSQIDIYLSFLKKVWFDVMVRTLSLRIDIYSSSPKIHVQGRGSSLSLKNDMYPVLLLFLSLAQIRPAFLTAQDRWYKCHVVSVSPRLKDRLRRGDAVFSLSLPQNRYMLFFLQRQTIAFAFFHLNTTYGSCLQISVPKTHVVLSVSKYILYNGCFLSFSLFLSQIQSVFAISQDCWSQQHMLFLSLSLKSIYIRLLKKVWFDVMV